MTLPVLDGQREQLHAISFGGSGSGIRVEAAAEQHDSAQHLVSRLSSRIDQREVRLATRRTFHYTGIHLCRSRPTRPTGLTRPTRLTRPTCPTRPTCATRLTSDSPLSASGASGGAGSNASRVR